MEKWMRMMPVHMNADIDLMDEITDYCIERYNAEIIGENLICEDGVTVAFFEGAVEVIPDGMYVFPATKSIYAKEEYTYNAFKQLEKMVESMKSEIVEILKVKMSDAIKSYKAIIEDVKAKDLRFVKQDEAEPCEDKSDITTVDSCGATGE